jgi:hypothetical protein
MQASEIDRVDLLVDLLEDSDAMLIIKALAGIIDADALIPTTGPGRALNDILDPGAGLIPDVAQGRN